MGELGIFPNTKSTSSLNTDFLIFAMNVYMKNQINRTIAIYRLVRS